MHFDRWQQNPNIIQMSIHLEREDNLEKNTTTLVPPPETLNHVNGPDTTWTPADVFRLSAVLVLMLLTLLGNVIVIITIVSCAELRKKRVNIFILNLAVGDLMVCFVSMKRGAVGRVVSKS